MKKSTIFASLAAFAAFLCSSAPVAAQEFMSEATMVFPYGFYSSWAPSSMEITWDNQPIELVDPTEPEEDWGDPYVTVYVNLGDENIVPAKAYLLNSYGNPEDPEDPDIWQLDVALYTLSELWSFDGPELQIIIPEGIVVNEKDEVNPEQIFTFYILPIFDSYTISPETGSTLNEDYIVKVGFDGNPIEYLQSEVTAYLYEPDYEIFNLEYGKEVSIVDNEIVIDLSGLEDKEYEVLIPEAFVTITVDGEKLLNPDLWLEYTIEHSEDNHVNSIFTSSQVENIYTLQGIKVKASNANQLHPGIYIIDGKKVIVKK